MLDWPVWATDPEIVVDQMQAKSGTETSVRKEILAPNIAS